MTGSYPSDYAQADGGRFNGFVSETGPQFTTCVTDPTLPAMFDVPLYVAVTSSLPTGKVLVVSFAFFPVSVIVPSAWPPLVKVTVPVTDVVVLVTVAVNVTDWPSLEGLSEEVTVVVVEAWLTT
jgi:hypothetical protein